MSENVVIDLGHGHTFRFVDGVVPRVGAMVSHICKNGVKLDSYIGLNAQYNTRPATWDLVSAEPVTLHPSLACTLCGDHGFIRAGKWVPA